MRNDFETNVTIDEADLLCMAEQRVADQIEWDYQDVEDLGEQMLLTVVNRGGAYPTITLRVYQAGIIDWPSGQRDTLFAFAFIFINSATDNPLISGQYCAPWYLFVSEPGAYYPTYQKTQYAAIACYIKRYVYCPVL